MWTIDFVREFNALTNFRITLLDRPTFDEFDVEIYSHIPFGNTISDKYTFVKSDCNTFTLQLPENACLNFTSKYSLYGISMILRFPSNGFTNCNLNKYETIICEYDGILINDKHGNVIRKDYSDKYLIYHNDFST